MSKPEDIESYLKGEMETEEHDLFRKELASDEELRREVILQRMAYLAIEKHGDAEIRERIHHWENPASPTLIKKYWWRIALPVLILAGVIFFYNDFSRSELNEQLFDEYFETVAYRGTSPTEAHSSDWNSAITAYRAQDYELASKYFKEHLIRHDETPEALFYTGMAFLSQQPPDLEKAQYYLGQVNGKNAYSGQAKWNLALAYLKDGRMVRTKNILRELLEDGNYRRDDVRELLTAISFVDRY